MRENFFDSVSLGCGDFLEFKRNLAEFFQFRDGKIFQILYFPESLRYFPESSREDFAARKNYFYYSRFFPDTKIRADLFFAVKNEGKVEVARVGVVPKEDLSDFYYVEYNRTIREINAFHFDGKNNKKLIFTKGAPNVEWESLGGLSLGSTLGGVSVYICEKGKDDSHLFSSRIRKLTDNQNRPRIVVQVSGEENFSSESTINIDISRIFTLKDFKKLSGIIEDIEEGRRYLPEGLRSDDAIALCDSIQKMFSNFFPLWL